MRIQSTVPFKVRKRRNGEMVIVFENGEVHSLGVRNVRPRYVPTTNMVELRMMPGFAKAVVKAGGVMRNGPWLRQFEESYEQNGGKVGRWKFDNLKDYIIGVFVLGVIG